MLKRKSLVGFGCTALVAMAAIFVFATSDGNCQSAWNQSEASNSCSGGQGSNSSAYVEWRSARQECIVSAYCKKDGGGTQYNQVYGSTGDLRSLKNCNGALKESC